jgi:hypothetical protein
VRQKQVLDGRPLGPAPFEAMHGAPKVSRRSDDTLRPLRVTGCRISGALGMVKDDHGRKFTASGAA